MTHISTQFNLESMPLDAYLTFLKAIADPILKARITDLNFGWFFDSDDSIYDDRNLAMERFLPVFAEHYDKYRRLSYMYRELSRATKFNARSVWEAFYPVEMQPYNRFIPYLESLHDADFAYRQAHTEFGLDFRLRVPMLDRFQVPNMGSWGVNIISQAREEAERIIRDGSVILHRHWERTGWRFLLRHPIAMGAPAMTDMLYLKRHPIRDQVAHYLGTARSMVYDVIQGVEPTTWLPFAVQGQFNSWMDRTATAMFVDHVGNPDSYWMLTPADLPSVLTLPSHTLLPIAIDAKLTPSLNDHWQLIQHTQLHEVIDGRIRRTSTVDESILQLGWLMCMAATILSMNIKVGTGQERLRWLHSTMNAAHVGEAMTLAPMILHKANEVVNG